MRTRTLRKPKVEYICSVDNPYGRTTRIYKLEAKGQELYWKCTGKPIDLTKDIISVSGVIGGNMISYCKVEYGG